MKKKIGFFLLSLIMIFAGFHTIFASEPQVQSQDLIPSENMKDRDSMNSNIRDETKKILEAYKQGKALEEPYVSKRRNVVNKYKLNDQVNTSFFFNKDVVKDYATMLSFLHDDRAILVDPSTSFTQGIEPSFAMRKMSCSQSSCKVTYFWSGYYTTISQGAYSYTWIPGQWAVDGHVAYCGTAKKPAPKVGDVLIQNRNVSANENLRKVLYYGLMGPQDRLLQACQNDIDKAALVTNELTSYAFSNTTICQLVTGKNFVVDQYGWIFNLPSPPASFQIYAADSTRQDTNDFGTDICQTLIYFKENQKGSLQIIKKSSNPEMSQNSKYYSLEGAKYGLYRCESDAQNNINPIGIFTTDASGKSNVIKDLTFGTYYLKEIQRPNGFAMDPKVHSISLQSNQLFQYECLDAPQGARVDLLIQKKNKKPELEMSLQNAQFEVHFFDEFLDEKEIETKTPTKSWTFKSDKQGLVYLDPSYLIDGDPLYFDSKHEKAILPFGTIKIKEIKAPSGFRLDEKSYVYQIHNKTDNEWLVIDQSTVIENEPIEILIRKVHKDTQIPLENVTFSFIAPNQEEFAYQTDAQGCIHLKNILVGRYTIEETHAPLGYQNRFLNFTCDVSEDGTIQVNTNSNLIKVYREKNGNVEIVIENEVIPYDLTIKKINPKKVPLNKAKFGLYEDSACQNQVSTITTNRGEGTFYRLKNKKNYYVKEIKAPEGYQMIEDLQGNPHVYSIMVDHIPAENRFILYIDGKAYPSDQIRPDGPITYQNYYGDLRISMEVINIPDNPLPKTGSITFITFMLISLSIGLCIRHRLVKNNMMK